MLAWTISVDELRKWAENDLVPKAKLAFKGEGEYLKVTGVLFAELQLNVEQEQMKN